MAKTDKQLLLEARNPGKSIREILIEALERRRGEAHLVEVAAGDLGVAKATLSTWCREYRVEVNQFKYRLPSQVAADSAPAESDGEG